jgi:hypothetical protein
VLIAAAVPVLLLILATLGRTGAAARDIADLDTVRRPASALTPRAPVLDVRVPPLSALEPAREPVISRNPFTYAPSGLPPAPVPLPVAMPPLQVMPDVPPSVVLSLIGVATTTRADGRAERTAIILGGPLDPLYMVREADVVTARYRVDAILPDSVVLVDTSGASLRLTLR